ncbi:TetR family transcriptional regulator [Curtobacterium sp. PhB130]|uniref:TetR/AcrR family transcriptional regulator n=1 Tax=unclassified Curtobacterium TaxID=257496 RepID=UPI000F4D01A0|nr:MULTISPECIES: TetR/AcrR family transcriptional regulator [unclassified Curtobacterium]ROP64831.1 TetR family transcriptional regulator [Curtobacterium sp. ZW137]ROS75122.1 TetR family transcriptional regulator [Curtobacterium sp. PhB130]TCK63751.1 TetR family transcriptional regulator [Curtobacterium sp. PhB136]
MTDRPPTARDLARETIRGRILAAARARLTDEGPAQLSLRAVARDVGMVSSALYRYFPSRDDLLTALLVQDYDELGDAVERADAAHNRQDVGARWLAACRAVRDWSVAHPGDFALLYGSPVPGYAAPQETIEPATRATMVLVRIVVDAMAGRPLPPPTVSPAPRPVGSVVDGAAAYIRSRGIAKDAPAEAVMRTLMAWTAVFGTVSFELFGHYVGSVSDHAAYFDLVVERLAADIGFSVDVHPQIGAAG